MHLRGTLTYGISTSTYVNTLTWGFVTKLNHIHEHGQGHVHLHLQIRIRTHIHR